MRTLIVFLILLTKFPCLTQAQDFPWARNFFGIDDEYNYSTCSDNNGDILVCGTFTSQIFNIGNYTLNKYSGSNPDAFVAKFDKSGSIIWVKQFKGLGSKYLFKIRCSKKGSIYLLGSFTDVVFFDTLILTSNNINYNRVSIIKLNSAGSLVSEQSFRFSNQYLITFEIMALDNDDNLIIPFQSHITDTLFYNGGFINASTSNTKIIKVDSNLNFIWGINSNSNSFIDIDCDSNNNIIITGLFNASTTISNKTVTSCYSTNNTFLAAINSVGIVNWIKCIGLQNFVGGNPRSFVTINKDNSITVVGSFGTNIHFDTSVSIVQANTFVNIFIAQYSPSGNIQLVKKGKMGTNSGLAINDVKSNLRGDIIIVAQPSNGSFTYEQNQVKALTNTQSYIYILKIDKFAAEYYSYGTGTYAAPKELAIDDLGDLYLTGNFSGASINFGNQQFTNQGNNDAFLVKISDISISQIQPIKLNYCSNDSLRLGYITSGKFQAGNKFKAQLSNSVGIFDSTATVIGIRSDTFSNTIACRLPAQLIGSTQYKIRIISDSPSVVSFYDTTTYNIQTKPIASAGADTSVCYGQSIALGNSASMANNYLWQPSALLVDSTLKYANTKTRANQGVYYFTLKASNQHCISWDTVKTTFLPPLKISLPKDTILCYNSIAIINPLLSGGVDSNRYVVNWYKNSFASSVGLGKTKLIPSDSPSLYYAVLNDGCSISDTSSTSILISHPRKLITALDPFICKGNSLKLFAINYRPDTIGYNLKWYNENRVLISTSDTLVEDYNTTTKRYLISNANCYSAGDTSVITINVAPPLILNIMPDTTICYGQSFILLATAMGGDSSKYQLKINSFLNDSLFTSSYNSIAKETRFQRNIQFCKDTLLHVTLTDACSLIPATDSVFITVIPKVILAPVIIPNHCEGSAVVLKAGAKFGKEPYLYSWINKLNSNIVSNSDSLFIQSSSLSSYIISVADQCQNHDTLVVLVKPGIRPLARFVIVDTSICANEFTNVTNLSENAQMLPMSYVWHWQKDSISDFNQRTILNKPGVYNLTLITTLPDNCSDTFSKQNAVFVSPNPIANFKVDNTIVSKNETLIQFINLTIPALNNSYLWAFGDTDSSILFEPQHLFISAGNYTISLIVVNENGCTDTLTKIDYITVRPGKNVYLPSAFTLDGDGINDEFKPLGSDVKNWDLVIYNRWNIPVFSGNEKVVGFKGYDNTGNILLGGVYFYRINITTMDDVKFTIEDNLTILR